MTSQKIEMVAIRSALFKVAMPRQKEAIVELGMEQSMLSDELKDRGLRSDKNRKKIHRYYFLKTKCTMPYKVFWGKYIYLNDIKYGKVS